MVEPKITVDVSEFMISWNRISNEVPMAVISGFAQTAERARDSVRDRTRQVFNLHSDYIPNAVLSIPSRKWKNRKKRSGWMKGQRQYAAALKGLTGKYHDFQAAVFLRGSASPKKSLDFMAVHEYGGMRPAVEGQLAIPRKGVTKKKYRTGLGRVKSIYLPAKMLARYNAMASLQFSPMGGSNFYLHPKQRRQKGRRKKPEAFIIKSKFGHGAIIVKRRFKRTWAGKQRTPLDIMYKFLPTVHISKRWNFVSTVYKTVDRYIHQDVISKINRVK